MFGPISFSGFPSSAYKRPDGLQFGATSAPNPKDEAIKKVIKNGLNAADAVESRSPNAAKQIREHTAAS